MGEIPFAFVSERKPQGPTKLLLVQAENSLFRVILKHIRFASKRQTFITPAIPGETDRQVKWALGRGQSFDLVVIEVMDKNEIEQAFELTANIKRQLPNNPSIALSLPEREWVTEEQMKKGGVDYITDQLGQEQGLRSLLLFAEAHRLTENDPTFLAVDSP